MKIRPVFPVILSLSFLLILVSCGSGSETAFQRSSDFNARWEFHMGDLTEAADPGQDAAGWLPVHLPHDWSILDYEHQDSLHPGPFFKDLPGGRSVGYLRDGTAWYRKVYITPGDLEQNRVILEFDGVQSQMELWVNGRLVGEHVYGYTPFQFDITEALNAGGEENVIAVKTVNPGENSRWFAGAGIYREVSLSVLSPVSIAPWGVCITTPEANAGSAQVHVEVTVQNRMESPAEVSCEIHLLAEGKAGKEFRIPPTTLASNATAILTASTGVEDPALWNLEDPNLYMAEVILYADGREVDRYPVRFGIRSIEYSVEQGFLLNGKEILMRGACMHHDNGLLGAAAFRDAEYRRVRRMKDNGYNAIRTSHNPPSSHFLDACDEYGMLVIDESFDQWTRAKTPNDYSNYFEQWHVADIQAMVYRDRNHPSVVMWSFGNEVPERADPEGIEIGKALARAIREVDETRPVTQAVCSFWDQPGKEWDYSAGAFSMLDIGGYNYMFQEYEADHALYPERIMYGSESVPQHAWENWEMVKRHKYVLGDFVWTGMDYIGESGIGHHRLVGSENQQGNFLKPWPWYISWCGDLDILGNKKPQSHYRDIIWDQSKLEMMVVRPVPAGMRSEISYWGWYDELPGWNWEGKEGEPMKVKIYTSYPEVKLELNGEIIGTRTLDSTDRFTAEFEVAYAAGELKASGMLDGSEMESYSLQTAGETARLQLDAEVPRITAGPNKLAFIQVSARDAEGLPVPENESMTEVKVTGPATLQAAGNASPELQGSFTDGTFRLFRGRGMVIIRSSGDPGEIVIQVSSGDLESARAVIRAD